jgi:hypothetical protein
VIHDRIVRGSSPEAVALTPLDGLAPLYVDRR